MCDTSFRELLNRTWVCGTERTKIITVGDCQTVEIPPDLWLSGETVFIRKVGSAPVLLPVDDLWEALFSGRALVTDDYLDHREQLPWQERDELK